MGKAAQIHFLEPIVFSGGVANNIGIVRTFEKILNKKIYIPSNPQSTAALGGAIYAKRLY